MLRVAFALSTRLTACLAVFEDEYTTNYVATVMLIKFFLPHFLKLSVSPLNILARPHCDIE